MFPVTFVKTAESLNMIPDIPKLSKDDAEKLHNAISANIDKAQNKKDC